MRFLPRAAIIAAASFCTGAIAHAAQPEMPALEDHHVAPRAPYATLVDAVAAQEPPAALDGELHCLAVGVYYESKGEPLAGQLAVAEVILNRAASGLFPKTVCEVLTQRGQFSFVRGGKLPTPPDDAAWRKAMAVAQVAQKELWASPVDDALFFHATYVSPGWKRPRAGTIGRHIFYR